MLLHADADAFFVSVALRDMPHLWERPVAVGSHIICSANYPARALGVRSAMRLRQALRICPQLEVVRLEPGAYNAASTDLIALFEHLACAAGGRVEPVGVEEAFLDVGSRDPVEVARELRRRARSELGLPVSVGVARSRLYAKLGSRRAKPDGLVLIDAAEEQRLRATLGIGELWGVGPRSQERLDAAGIGTIPQLAGHTERSLSPIVGVAMARRLVAIHAGTDDAEVHLRAPRRQVAASRTLGPASRNRTVVECALDRVTRRAADRLVAVGGFAHSVELTLRLEDGTRRIERSTLPTATTDPAELLDCVLVLSRLTGYADDGRAVVNVTVAMRLSGMASSREQSPLPL